MGTISKRRSQEQPWGDFCSVTHACPAPEQLRDSGKVTGSPEGMEPTRAPSQPLPPGWLLLGNSHTGGLETRAQPNLSEAAEEVENRGVLAETIFISRSSRNNSQGPVSLVGSAVLMLQQGQVNEHKWRRIKGPSTWAKHCS